MALTSSFITRMFALVVLAAYAASALSDQQFILKDSPDDPGHVIVFSDGAQLDIAVTATGIALTVPNVDLRVRCLGDPTEEGYCLIEAGGNGGGGNPEPEGDADSDGVPDSKDNCAATPSGSFVNANGCSEAQLGGPTEPDADGDGVPDSTDNCDFDPNPDQDDADNDGIGDECDSTPNGGGGPGTTEYCSSPQSSRVDCSVSRNLDTYHENRGEIDLVVETGTILSLPFTTRASSSDGADLVHSTDRGPLNTADYIFTAWVSKLPGGEALSSNCMKQGAQARFTLTMTQFSRGCELGSSAGTFYVNYAVRGAAGYLNEAYKFQLDRFGSSGRVGQ